MAELKTLIAGMVASGAFNRILRDPRAQFGLPNKTLLGATLLPERGMPENAYTEYGVRYRTVIANDTARYSPPVKKGGTIVGKVDVRLVDQDIAADYSSEDYDAHIAAAKYNTNSPENLNNPTMTGATAIENWFEARINRALIEKIEVMRWQAIVDAQVKLVGANGYEDTLDYPNPAGHRFTVGGNWSNDAYDPLAGDIYPLMELAEAKGNNLRRIIMSRTAAGKLMRNAKVRQQVSGLIVIDGSTTLQAAALRLGLARLNDHLAADGLPAIEIYNEVYNTQTGSFPFLKRDVFVATCSTGRDNSIAVSDANTLVMPDTIGYAGIGRAAGQPTPGRATFLEYKGDKPPRVDAQGWQTSAPVILDPEAFYVGRGIS